MKPKMRAAWLLMFCLAALLSCTSKAPMLPTRMQEAPILLPLPGVSVPKSSLGKLGLPKTIAKAIIDVNDEPARQLTVNLGATDTTVSVTVPVGPIKITVSLADTAGKVVSRGVATPVIVGGGAVNKVIVPMKTLIGSVTLLVPGTSPVVGTSSDVSLPFEVRDLNGDLVDGPVTPPIQLSKTDVASFSLSAATINSSQERVTVHYSGQGNAPVTVCADAATGQAKSCQAIQPLPQNVVVEVPLPPAGTPPIVPGIKSVDPPSLTIGDGIAHTITFKGSQFTPDMVIQWAQPGSAPNTNLQLIPRYVDNSTLVLDVQPAGTQGVFAPLAGNSLLQLKPGPLLFNVVRPSNPGAETQAKVSFSLFNPKPTITAIRGTCGADSNCVPSNGFDVRILGTGIVTNMTWAGATSTRLYIGDSEVNYNYVGPGELQLMANGQHIRTPGQYALKACNVATSEGEVCARGTLTVVGNTPTQPPPNTGQPSTPTLPTPPQGSQTATTPTTPNTVVVQPGPAEGKDIWTTSVFSHGPQGGYPGGGLNNEELRVGGYGDEYRSLIQFHLEGLPQHASTAVLQLYTAGNNGGTATAMYLDRITTDWNWDRNASYPADRLWWRDRPGYAQLRQIPAPVVGTWATVDITDLYNAWKSGAYPNYGLELRPTTTDKNFNVFWSSDYMVDTSLRPKLVITS